MSLEPVRLSGGKQDVSHARARTEGLSSEGSAEHFVQDEPEIEPQKPRKKASFSPELWGARMRWAKSFNAIMRGYQRDRELRYSNAAIARICGVSEREVRFWRSGERSIPASALDLMPWPIVRRLRKQSDKRRKSRGVS